MMDRLLSLERFAPTLDWVRRVVVLRHGHGPAYLILSHRLVPWTRHRRCRRTQVLLPGPTARVAAAARHCSPALSPAQPTSGRNACRAAFVDTAAELASWKLACGTGHVIEPLNNSRGFSRFASRRSQWLPSELDVSPNGVASFCSYVDGIHPETHAPLCAPSLRIAGADVLCPLRVRAWRLALLLRPTVRCDSRGQGRAVAARAGISRRARAQVQSAGESSHGVLAAVCNGDRASAHAAAQGGSRSAPPDVRMEPR